MSILEDLTDLNPSTSELSTYTSPQEPVTPLTPGPQPVILSPRYSPAPAVEPREAPPLTLTPKEQPSVRAGVIKRNPSFSAEAAPSYTPRESSASPRPLNMAASPHTPLASYTSSSSLTRALLADSIRQKSRSLSSDSLPSMLQTSPVSIDPNGNFIETNIQL